jgi:hypothetical protein
MEAQGERKLPPNHSRPRHYMGVSGWRYTLVTLYPQGKDPQYPLDRRLGGPQSRSRHRGKRTNPHASAGDRTSIAQSSSLQPDTILTELPRLQLGIALVC